MASVTGTFDADTIPMATRVASTARNHRRASPSRCTAPRRPSGRDPLATDLGVLVGQQEQRPSVHPRADVAVSRHACELGCSASPWRGVEHSDETPRLTSPALSRRSVRQVEAVALVDLDLARRRREDVQLSLARNDMMVRCRRAR